AAHHRLDPSAGDDRKLRCHRLGRPAGQLPLTTRSVTLRAVAGRGAIEAALSNDLAALQSAAAATDLAAITDAQNELHAFRSTPDPSAAIAHILKIVSDLAAIAMDTTLATSVTTPRGVTTYSYDAAGRVVSDRSTGQHHPRR